MSEWLVGVATGLGAAIAALVGVYLAKSRRRLNEAQAAHEVVGAANLLLNPLKDEITRLHQRLDLLEQEARELRDRNEQALRREADLRLVLFAIAPEPIVAVDRDGVIVEANRGAYDAFGWPAGGLLGQLIEVLVPDRLGSKHEEHRAIYTRNPVARPIGLDRDLVGKKYDGAEFPVQVALAPMSDGSTIALVKLLEEES